MIDLDPTKFDETVLKATGPVLVYATATWCGPCRTLRPIVEAFETTVGGRATIVKVDADTCREVVRGLGVRGVPTLIAFENGVEKGRHVGAATSEQLATLLGV